MKISSLSLLLFFFCNISVVTPTLADAPYLLALADRTPEFAGERLAIVGGFAIARRHNSEASQLVSDGLLITIVENTNAEAGWAWFRDGSPGKDFNTDDKPVELSWYPFQPGDDISVHLHKLRNNLGDTLIWRPAPVDAVMSFIDWGEIHILKMKAPSRNITIKNVPASDKTHAPSIGATSGYVSHHRMWHFPQPPTGTLEIGESGSAFKVTFTDASFDAANPWRWTQGARWGVQPGACKNSHYLPGSSNKSHERFYQRIRWYSLSGFIDILVPGNGDKDYPATGIPIKLHSNFRHIKGNAVYARSVPVPKRKSNGRINLHYNANTAGGDALALEVSGEYYDAGIEFRAHGKYHPVKDLWLQDVVIADPYSLGTAYPGEGPPTSQKAGGCSSLGRPSLVLGVYGQARGSVIFKYGAAGLSGHLVKRLHGADESNSFQMTYSNIGFANTRQLLASWDGKTCCMPKIDGFAALSPDNQHASNAIKLSIDVTGKFKEGLVHMPLALEWGADDTAGVDINKPIYADMKNSMLHFMPAPPLIPPTHFPTTQKNRIYIKTTHAVVPITSNPWVTFYSNMTLQKNSEFPYSLVLKGAMDESIPKKITVDEPGQAFLAEDFTVLSNPELRHSAKHTVPGKIRLGIGNWPPPKYTWFQGNIIFENVAANGEFIYSPAWNNHAWTLRIDKPLQTGVKIKLGEAQSFSGKFVGKKMWQKGQVAQRKGKKGYTNGYYTALKKTVPKNSDALNKNLWREVENPFDNMTLIYRGATYQVPKSGVVVNSSHNLERLDNPGKILNPL